MRTSVVLLGALLISHSSQVPTSRHRPDLLRGDLLGLELGTGLAALLPATQDTAIYDGALEDEVGPEVVALSDSIAVEIDDQDLGLGNINNIYQDQEKLENLMAQAILLPSDKQFTDYIDSNAVNDESHGYQEPIFIPFRKEQLNDNHGEVDKILGYDESIGKKVISGKVVSQRNYAVYENVDDVPLKDYWKNKDRDISVERIYHRLRIGNLGPVTFEKVPSSDDEDASAESSSVAYTENFW